MKNKEKSSFRGELQNKGGVISEPYYLYWKMIFMFIIGIIGLPLSLFHLKLLLFDGIIHITMLIHLILIPLGIYFGLSVFIEIQRMGE